MTSTTEETLAAASPSNRLPMAGLLALAMTCFLTVLTEAMPAGLLPQISAGLAVTEAMAGQMVTVFAIGIVAAAIPLTMATNRMRRRPLLLTAICGFAIVNTVTAVSDDYNLILVARFFAGVFAGLFWSLMAGYATRMVAPHLQGRAIAVAMIGVPLALALGIPAGTFLGGIVGWRAAFGIMSLFTVILIGWVLATVPDFPGQAAGQRRSLIRVFMMPGIRSVLFVTVAFVLAHMSLYTYIAPFVARAGLADQVDLVLLTFGITSIGGTWITGLVIDRWLRQLVLASVMFFGLAMLALGLWGDAAILVFAAIALWGLAFGGVPTLFQTACAKAAGEAADVAQSMMVTVWNMATAAGGLVGGLLLESQGAASFPWAALVLLLPVLLTIWRAKSHGFPVTTEG
ncbi:MFS transporter [Aestuariispira ectoiniformans]|uniref:MFS transporter n=1 Tax=Aestuariispira ectoiniformans TaxID=2775080 RepID=UPI00223A77A2|nr:MFS transporter [Aestuariispira ectoiniformans]